MAAKETSVAAHPTEGWQTKAFTIAAGLFFLVVVTKFGDPIILDNLVVPPDSLASMVFDTWQIKWGYYLLVLVVVFGLMTIQARGVKFKWLAALPAAWLIWEFIAATQTISPQLSTLTVEHFTACVVLFYLGYFSLRRVANPWPIWVGLSLGLCWQLRTGIEQHAGGLDATQKMIYSLKTASGIPDSITNDPNYWKRIAAKRVFATFSSPDAFAGSIELFLPLALVFLWQLTPKLRPLFRVAFVVLLGCLGLACLYWTGSKAGWLVAVLMGLLALICSRLPTPWKRGLVAGLLIAGTVVFTIRNMAFFHKQQNSAGARLVYWKAALTITKSHPVFGTGPGTFAGPYSEIKRPNDEMARLCHNDYLEQACDSGVLGCFLYVGMVFGLLFSLYRYRMLNNSGNFDQFFAVLLGLFAISLHSAVDYHLYVPALAWPMFFLFGWMFSFVD